MMGHVLVVGAGFTGCTAARVLAERGYRVSVFERRDHLGGNAYDELVGNIFVHRYGPHLFHTNSVRVRDFVQRFSSWRPYNHCVQGQFETLVYPLPPNFVLLDLLFGSDSKRVQSVLLENFAADQRVALHVLEGHCDPTIRAVAKEIKAIVYKPYTEKMWGKYSGELLNSTQARVPFVTGYSTGYFTDSFQALPSNGYAAFFTELVNHPNISLEHRHFEFHAVKRRGTPVIYTGPLDEVLEYEFGALPYRSINFRFLHSDTRLPVGTVNYNDWRSATRVTDMAITVDRHTNTTILVEETPCDYTLGKNEPLYPIQATRWRTLYNRYAELVRKDYPQVTLAGRMGRYQYYDMDQACATAIRIGEQL